MTVSIPSNTQATVLDALMPEARVSLTEARTGLIMKAPFFANLLFDRMTCKWTLEIPTAGTDGRTIWLNPGFFCPLPQAQKLFLLAHEVGHGFLLHFARAKNLRELGVDGQPFQNGRYNKACDYIINDLLIHSKIGEFIPSGLHDQDIGTYKDYVLDVYRKLPDEPDPPGKGGKPCEEGEDGEGGGGEPIDGEDMGTAGVDHHIIPAEGNSKSEEFEWKQAVAQAKEAAKAMGNMPGALAEFIDDFLDPSVDWTEQLRHAMVRCAGRNTKSWKRPNRKRLVMPPHVYLPRKMGFGAGKVVLAVDTSGSVSTDELRKFFGEMSSILSEMRPEECWVIFCDTQVNAMERIENVSELQEMAKETKGRGGTSFEPVFKKIEEEHMTPDTLVYFTDMECYFPDKPNYPVIWCASTDIEAPWGETIRVQF